MSETVTKIVGDCDFHGKKYVLKTISDLCNVPLEKLDQCLSEVGACIRTRDAVCELSRVPLPLLEIEWYDDGKSDVAINIKGITKAEFDRINVTQDEVPCFAGSVVGTIEKVLSDVFDLRRWHSFVLAVVRDYEFWGWLSGVAFRAVERNGHVLFFVDPDEKTGFDLEVLRQRVEVLNGARRDDAGVLHPAPDAKE